jgi:hypothetical protein
MDLGSIVAMEQLGHDLIAPLVHVLDNREWGPDPGERGIPIELTGWGVNVCMLHNREWGPDPGERGIPIELTGWGLNVCLLHNREWGPDPGERGIPIELTGWGLNVCVLHNREWGPDPGEGRAVKVKGARVCLCGAYTLYPPRSVACPWQASGFCPFV